MSWTYTANFTLSRDEIRLLIGDTDATDPQLQDEEIAYLYADEGSIREAAARAAETLAARYARRVDLAIDGNVQVKASQRQQQYLALADRLRSRSAAGAVMPLAGGLRTDTPPLLPFVEYDPETGEVRQGMLP